MTTAYLSHYKCEKHKIDPEHPESPFRLGAIQDRLISGQLLDYLTLIDAQAVELEHLYDTHSRNYVDHIISSAPLEGMIELDAETVMTPHSLNAALYAAGAVVQAVDLVMDKKVENAFCAVRPPGHHAEYAKSMGFCFFNNVAVGAQYAITHHGLERIAIVDFDVHHGNGTEDIFQGNRNVLFASSYQHPFYPYSDPGESHDNIIHIPLEAGTNGETFRMAMSNQLLSALDAFRPELIMISAGFDAHKEDSLGQLRLGADDYAWITDQLVVAADKHCDGKIVSVLEGGYHLDALGRAAFQHIRSLMKLR
ncbi:histone deacetylase family protein [Marinomonas mediterranea]|jgi:Deacetylases, including yeast histone deacetylase and acetoin utilization protein|uniref:Histone deacetylase superfamily n=1 Tax=Marinomonas mediterranea (strain ATCC 700492 / JCM 21426 / NBRC 103028 / MMB-1) TaxID=717774 RepID=F2JUH0_MARM1|nr:histone deacetylase family protein [Marinomonas mediterranea]ADZ92789.1 histone deacetylase superfamily [Marinomonas mediterranea MMB-1]WCN18814.1 histone deacetylase family protein [Marinomonas mediterranea MMB-1]